jgi:DNA-directed RNA polymerase beta subunit
MEEIDKITWNIIDKLFRDNPNLLVKHHLDSFNKFFNEQIYNIFREKNPIKIFKDENADTKEFNYL